MCTVLSEQGVKMDASVAEELTLVCWNISLWSFIYKVNSNCMPIILLIFAQQPSLSVTLVITLVITLLHVLEQSTWKESQNGCIISWKIVIFGTKSPIFKLSLQGEDEFCANCFVEHFIILNKCFPFPFLNCNIHAHSPI